jgi:hypothetical protein
MKFSTIVTGIGLLSVVLSACAQTDAGGPKAGLTEEEHAGRDGKLAAPQPPSPLASRGVAIHGGGGHGVGRCG